MVKLEKKKGKPLSLFKIALLTLFIGIVILITFTSIFIYFKEAIESDSGVVTKFPSVQIDEWGGWHETRSH